MQCGVQNRGYRSENVGERLVFCDSYTAQISGHDPLQMLLTAINSASLHLLRVTSPKPTLSEAVCPPEPRSSRGPITPQPLFPSVPFPNPHVPLFLPQSLVLAKKNHSNSYLPMCTDCTCISSSLRPSNMASARHMAHCNGCPQVHCRAKARSSTA